MGSGCRSATGGCARSARPTSTAPPSTPWRSWPSSSGLDAAQVMIPADHLLLEEARALPAIVVVRLPRGDPHFVVVWRRVGRLVQVMDPARGRHWVTGRALLSQLYRHAMPVPAAAWREWAGSDEHLLPLRRRLERPRRAAGATRLAGRGRASRTRGGGRWRRSTRRPGRWRRWWRRARCAAAVRPPARSASLIDRAPLSGDDSAIPDELWSVAPATSGPDGEEQVLLRGAVLVRVRGRRAETAGEPAPAPLRPDLAAALRSEPERPLRDLLRLLTGRGRLGPGWVVGLASWRRPRWWSRRCCSAACSTPAATWRWARSASRRSWRVVAFAAGRWLLQGQLFAGALRLGRLLEGGPASGRAAQASAPGRRLLPQPSHLRHGGARPPDSRPAHPALRSGRSWSPPWRSWSPPRSASPGSTPGRRRWPSPPRRWRWGCRSSPSRCWPSGTCGCAPTPARSSRFYLDALLGLVAVRAHGAERRSGGSTRQLLVRVGPRRRPPAPCGALLRGGAGRPRVRPAWPRWSRPTSGAPRTAARCCCSCTGRSSCRCWGRRWRSSPARSPASATSCCGCSSPSARRPRSPAPAATRSPRPRRSRSACAG